VLVNTITGSPAGRLQLSPLVVRCPSGQIIRSSHDNCPLVSTGFWIVSLDCNDFSDVSTVTTRATSLPSRRTSIA
jgi:hypothetical protein